MDLHQWDWCDISRIFSLPSVWTSVVRITWVSPAEHLNRWGWDGAREERSKSADSNAKYTYAQDTALLCYFGGRLFESFLVTRAKLFVFKWREERSFPGGSVVKRHRRHGFDPWVRKIPWRREWQTTPILLSGKFHGQRNLVGYRPRGHKESDMTERLSLQRQRIHKISVYYKCHITVLHALPINSSYINKCIFITSRMLINMVKF